MLNIFASTQHINQMDFQSAWECLMENLRLWRSDYETKQSFIDASNDICNQYEEPSPLTKEDNEAIASLVWNDIHATINS